MVSMVYARCGSLITGPFCPFRQAPLEVPAEKDQRLLGLPHGAFYEKRGCMELCARLLRKIVVVAWLEPAPSHCRGIYPSLSLLRGCFGDSRSNDLYHTVLFSACFDLFCGAGIEKSFSRLEYKKAMRSCSTSSLFYILSTDSAGCMANCNVFYDLFGNPTVKVEPLAGALRTVMLPPHSSTTRMTSASPRPFPSLFLEESP